MPTIYRPRRQKKNEGDQYDKERRKVYSSARWREIRKLKFQLNPLCERCEEKGLIVPAEDIHHTISFMSTTNPEIRYNLAYDMNNLQSLCKQCHQEIHNMLRYSKAE